MPRNYFRGNYKNRQKNKFGVSLTSRGKERRTVNGVLCASYGEAKRYKDLLLLEKLGKIKNLVHQPKMFKLIVEGELITSYRPDFMYVDITKTDEETRVTIEDFKGHPTEEFKIKWKLMHALYKEYNYLITTTKDLS